MCNGHRVLWTVVAHPSAPPSLCTVSGDIMGDLLTHFASLFMKPSGLPPLRQHLHQIHLTPGTAPVAVQPYQYVYLQKEELERQCVEMLAHGVIRLSSSALSAPVLLVKKHNGSRHFCVDYHVLNEKTIKDKFHIPVVEELLDELRSAAFFTKLDLRFGYHQVQMHQDDIEKTDFRMHQGLFEFLVMPFGLTNALATFQTLMNDVLRPFRRWFVLVFFDGILIYSQSWLEHLLHLRLVFAKLQEHQLYIKRSKFEFGASSVAYLGHVISSYGVAMDQLKVQRALTTALVL
jgi:hypothetical protein